jgi:flagellar hook-basal body complex protein FliE
MQGKAPLQQVVQAVMQADQALRTVVAVRDKVVGAYQEISRMQI